MRRKNVDGLSINLNSMLKTQQTHKLGKGNARVGAVLEVVPRRKIFTLHYLDEMHGCGEHVGSAILNEDSFCSIERAGAGEWDEKALRTWVRPRGHSSSRRP